MKFGICGLMTERGIQPPELARWVERNGFESLWFGEHTHTPTSIDGSRVPDKSGFDELYDPFVTLAAAAAVTSTLRLGLAVALLPQHHPITLAKTIASLDRISKGRILMGIGAGSRRAEFEDFGFSFDDRWKVVREFVYAMRAIWSEDVAAFEGRYISFASMRSWPKPMQPGGPPILEGAFSKWTASRIAEYGDGWIGYEGIAPEANSSIIESIRSAWAKAGRAGSPDMTMILPPNPDRNYLQGRVQALRDAGFTRIVFLMNPSCESEQHKELLEIAKIVQSFL